MGTNRRSMKALSLSRFSKLVPTGNLINSSSLFGIPKSFFFRKDKAGLFKIPRCQNTYRLEAWNPIKCEIVDKILINVMQNYLIGLKYEPQVCMRVCQEMSEEVCEKICRMKYDRYKFVIIMSIVQKFGQSVRMDFGKLWDVQRDTYSTYVIETPEFAAMGLVVATYYE